MNDIEEFSVITGRNEVKLCSSQNFRQTLLMHVIIV